MKKHSALAGLALTALLLFFASSLALAYSDGDYKKAHHPQKRSANLNPEDDDYALGSKHRPRKHFQSEFTLTGGDYLGDEWRNTWDLGGTYALYFNDTFGVGAGYMYSPMSVDASSQFGRSITDKDTHTIHGEFYLTNDCGFRAGKTLIECDLFTYLGGGTMQINDEWEPAGLVGGGMRFYMPVRHFSIRVDIASYLHPTATPGGDRFNADVLMNLGLSFYFNMGSKKSHP